MAGAFPRSCFVCMREKIQLHVKSFGQKQGEGFMGLEGFEVQSSRSVFWQGSYTKSVLDPWVQGIDLGLKDNVSRNRVFRNSRPNMNIAKPYRWLRACEHLNIRHA